MGGVKMRNVLALFCFIILALVSSSVFAVEDAEVATPSKEGYYLSGNAGMSWLEDADIERDFNNGSAKAEYDTGFLFGGAFGYDFGMFRTEAEFGYRENDMDTFKDVSIDGIYIGDLPASGKITTLSYLINSYIDFENDSYVTPYIGGGLGIADINLNDLRVNDKHFDKDDTVFAYQAAAGLGYDIDENLTLDVGYRYFATEDPKIDGLDEEYNDHNISFTVRYKFW